MSCTSLSKRIRCMTDSTCSINHIINQDTCFTFNITNDIHNFRSVHFINTTTFVNDSNWRFQTLCQFTRTSHTTMVRRNNNYIISSKTSTIKVISNKRSTHQMVYRNIKESLNLGSMKVHSQKTINTSHLEHISNQFRCDWFT